MLEFNTKSNTSNNTKLFLVVVIEQPKAPNNTNYNYNLFSAVALGHIYTHQHPYRQTSKQPTKRLRYYHTQIISSDTQCKQFFFFSVFKSYKKNKLFYTYIMMMKDERRKMKMKKQLSQKAAHQIGTCIYTEAYIMRILKSETFRNVFAIFIQIFTNDFLMLCITQAYIQIDILYMCCKSTRKCVLF